MRFLFLLLAISVGAPRPSPAAQFTTVVSVAPYSGITATGTSGQPAVSPDGRYVAFASDAGDVIVSTGLLPYFNVYFAERGAGGGLSLISVSTNGTGGDDYSLGASMSDDGRYVAFHSRAGNLAINDTNGTSDVFLRDRIAGTTVLVSRERSGGTASGCQSIAPLLSKDGRRLVFESNAADLVPNDTNNAPDIFVFDRLTGSNSLVSVNTTGNGSRAGASQSFTMSSNGQWVAFVNWRTNPPNQKPEPSQIYVRELPGGPILWASESVSSNLVEFRGASEPVLSADGRVLFFLAYIFSGNSKLLAYNASPSGAIGHSIGLFDSMSGTRTLVCSNCLNPSISSDGRRIAGVNDAMGSAQRVVLIDRDLNRTTIIGTNLASGMFSPGSATREPVLSGDARYLVFLAERTDGAPAIMTLYYRDLVRGLTMPLSLALDGGSGNGGSYKPQLAADGRTLVFTSFASDLFFNDHNKRPDIFAFRLGSPDVDQDGLDDDWEAAYFDTLDRDGLGDYDQDGQSDGAEFQSGTDPTNVGSVLSVMLLNDLVEHRLTIQWSSVPGRTYDVQYKDAVSGGWSNLFTAVLAEGMTKSVIDNSEPRPAQRFYRVVFAP